MVWVVLGVSIWFGGFLVLMVLLFVCFLLWFLNVFEGDVLLLVVFLLMFLVLVLMMDVWNVFMVSVMWVYMWICDMFVVILVM